MQHSLLLPGASRMMVTGHPVMGHMLDHLARVAPLPLPVLVRGETGVGKELVAQSIHQLSGKAGAFVPLNVTEVDENLIADALFGHSKGAFTGAEMVRGGLVEKASGGTLFLDEIGDLPPAGQAKLLRLLQEGEYYQVGSDRLCKANARMVMATHRDLEAMVESGAFRQDLYFRLRVVEIWIPPLRERVEDIPLLFDRILGRCCLMLEVSKPPVPRELLTLLKSYHFPGNIRELENMALDAMTHHRGGTLSAERFKGWIFRDPEKNAAAPAAEQAREGAGIWRRTLGSPAGEFPTLKQAEEFLIAEALEKAGGNQTIAAKMLGISRSALCKRLARM